MLRAIREIQPRWVVGENVRGLTNWNGGLVFDEVQADLENEGYEVTPYLLPACAVNAPHRRDRIWFVAKNTNEIRWRSGEWEEKPCKREQRDACARNNERICPNNGEAKTAANACESRRERCEQPRAFEQGNRREQPPRPTAKLHKVGDWQQFPTKPPVCSRNDGISDGLVGIAFSKHREKSIGAYGNAIVPQVALQIFKTIQEYENLTS